MTENDYWQDVKYIYDTFHDKSASRLKLLQHICNTTKNGITFHVELTDGNLLFTLRRKSIATMRVSTDLLYATTLREWHDKLTCIMKRMLTIA